MENTKFSTIKQKLDIFKDNKLKINLQISKNIAIISSKKMQIWLLKCLLVTSNKSISSISKTGHQKKKMKMVMKKNPNKRKDKNAPKF